MLSGKLFVPLKVCAAKTFSCQMGSVAAAGTSVSPGATPARRHTGGLEEVCGPQQGAEILRVRQLVQCQPAGGGAGRGGQFLGSKGWKAGAGHNMDSEKKKVMQNSKKKQQQ